MLIDYRPQFEPGEPNPPFVVISAGDLLAGKAAPQLAGKAVLIGFGGIDISDRLITPVSNQLPMPGVEINANVADMALSGRMLSQIRQFRSAYARGADERRFALGGGALSRGARSAGSCGDVGRRVCGGIFSVCRFPSPASLRTDYSSPVCLPLPSRNLRTC